VASVATQSARAAAAQVPVKTEPKTEQPASQRNAGRKKLPTSSPHRNNKRKTASLKADHKAGDRVYCEWPPNGKFYWARITKVNKPTKKRESPTYNVSLLVFPRHEHHCMSRIASLS
jgi:hypothetical protein